MAAEMKALFVIVNAGFSDQIIEVAQNLGARGATIIPARGTGQKFVKVLGIHYEPEREILLSVVPHDVAISIATKVKEKYGKATPTNGLAFILPVADYTFKDQ
ncbi:MAG: P-II family nitrogen regulator [Bacilli bacterium]|nr:P-II family nitrogen regulator [Bacilli bacterium]